MSFDHAVEAIEQRQRVLSNEMLAIAHGCDDDVTIAGAFADRDARRRTWHIVAESRALEAIARSLAIAEHLRQAFTQTIIPKR